MSIFSRIAKMIYEDEESDVIAEEELKTVSFASSSEEKKEFNVENNQPQEKIDDRTHINVKIEPVEIHDSVETQETVVSQQPKEVSSRLHEEIQQKKKSIRIDLMEPTVEKEEVKPRVTHSLAREEKTEYEFTPVISPMFGSSIDSSKKTTSKNLHSTPKLKNSNPLGIIISPYYGLYEEEEVEEVKTVAAATTTSETIANDIDFVENEVVEENSTGCESFEQEVATVEEEGLSLDELIQEQDVERNIEDFMQASLVGDHTPFEECNNENE